MKFGGISAEFSTECWPLNSGVIFGKILAINFQRNFGRSVLAEFSAELLRILNNYISKSVKNVGNWLAAKTSPLKF